MADREEIAKLESMYAANPEGRVFTHLAEAYRKAGDLARAREVLEDGLKRHADSASGYVVLGRVMQDLGEQHDAVSAFTRVLQLDPENRVALRALGELARAAGHDEEALGYLHQLRALDPTDEAVEAMVAELEAAPGGAARAPSPYAPPAAGEISLDMEPTSQPAENPADVAPLDLAGLTGHDLSDGADADIPPELAEVGLEPTAEAMFALPQSAPEEEAIGDLGSLELPSWEAAEEPSEELPTLPSLEGFDLGEGEGEEEADAPELPMLADLELSADEDAFETSEVPPLPQLTDEVVEEPPAPVPGLIEPAEHAEPAWQDDEPAEVVTETMAELYRSQGHPERAAEVYRALLRDRPGDEELERKLLELELAIISPSPFTAEGTGSAQADEPVEPAAVVAESAAATPVEAAAIPAMEAVWSGGGEVPADEPTPYAWEAAAEVEAGPPVSQYLRGLVAWRSSAPPQTQQEPYAVPELPQAPAAPEWEQQPEAYGAAPEPWAEASPGAEPEPSTADEGADAPWAQDAAPEPTWADEGGAEQTWSEPPAEAPWSGQTPAEAAWSEPAAGDAPWEEPPAEAAWGEQPAGDPWAAEADGGRSPEPEAAAPAEPDAAEDMAWLLGPDGVAPEAPESPVGPAAAGGASDVADAPGDDDDLEMFRAWLQSLKK